VEKKIRELVKEVEIKVPTPFGMVEIPLEPPVPLPPEIDERRARALLHTIGKDLSAVFNAIPLVGDVIADILQDLHAAEVRKILTPEEYKYYIRYDKVAPSVIAILRTYGRVRLRRKGRRG